MIDPKHSRPLDVHRWSDHPYIREVCNRLWEADLFDEYKDCQRSGRKPKTRFKDQLRVLILDLYVAWKTDPTLSLGVHMRLGDWKTNSRYNALHLSSVIPKLIHKLHGLGMIELSKGSFGGAGNPKNRTSRIKAAKPLIALFEDHELRLNELEPPRDRELLILRDENNKELEYEDTPKTRILRAALSNYNELLWSSFLDLPSFNEPFVERLINESPRMGKVQRVAIGGNDFAVRRVFSRGSWELNGRFYGGWWQMMPKDIRRQIHINDRPTVEIDFKGLHVAMLSKEQGVPLTDDPYTLASPPFPIEVEDQRGALKQLVLTAINAKNAKEAFGAFRNGFDAKNPEVHLTNSQLQQAIDLFIVAHPQLKPCLFADQGIRLMGKDSRIANAVINRLTREGIPTLCIHDSFIVDATYHELLQSEMDRATSYVLGTPFKTSITRGRHCNNRCYDGDEAHPPQLIRTPGYEARLAVWKASKQ